MSIKWLLPLLALSGFIFASYTVVSSNKQIPVAQSVAEPSFAPFQSFIAGAGIVESKSENIEIGTPIPGIVTSVPVKVGDQVKAGAVLFALDDRETKAELALRQADLAKALADVNRAKASLRDSQSLSRLAESVSDRRAISSEDLLKRHNAVLVAKAELETELAQTKQAKAAIATSQTTLDRLVIKAPMDGEVLQVNVHLGEFAPAGSLSKPLLVLGNLEQLHVRVDIDENDAWRFNKNSKAVAFLRGNRDFKADLVLAYVEPYVIPKQSLTGESTERVDTRVLQALYSFDRNQIPVYVGQQMDVFIEADGLSDSKNKGSASGKPPAS